MVFSSHIFLFYFLPIVLLLYYAGPVRWRSLMLTTMSYLFYGWWNPWFVLLMLTSTAIDYFCGRAIMAPGASATKRKAGLLTSVIANLAFLAFFKYFGFFTDNLNVLLGIFGGDPVPLPDFFSKIVLPVGISFYTFQSMSYSIDLYRGHARLAPSFLDFACYVALFPQLVAGPIVRYGYVAEQLHHRDHTLEGFAQGVARFIFGLAKKVILANPMGAIADQCFAAGDGSLGALAAWIGIVAYAFQIYFDFSGYSDMAVGLGKMFGFDFPENFNSPYRATSITDFWRRWHISLSSFLRDYLYIPLGGNRLGEARTYINLFLVMFIGGLWHGAQWTFVAWGVFHGVMLGVERAFGKTPFYQGLPRVLRQAMTFVLVLFAWVFFRAENFAVAAHYFGALFGFGGENPAAALLSAQILQSWEIFMLVVCALVTWGLPRTAEMVEELPLWKILWLLLLFIIALISLFGQGFNPFIYFQF